MTDIRYLKYSSDWLANQKKLKSLNADIDHIILHA